MPQASIDPTKNVSDQLDAAMQRQDDLRLNDRMWRDRLDAQTEKWRDKLDQQRIQTDALAREAEAGRLNALLVANTSNVALALEKQGAQAQAQDRRIAVLEQNQYQAGGKDIQRGESRLQGNFTISQFVYIGVAIVILLADLRSRGVI